MLEIIQIQKFMTNRTEGVQRVDRYEEIDDSFFFLHMFRKKIIKIKGFGVELTVTTYRPCLV